MIKRKKSNKTTHNSFYVFVLSQKKKIGRFWDITNCVKMYKRKNAGYLFSRVTYLLFCSISLFRKLFGDELMLHFLKKTDIYKSCQIQTFVHFSTKTRVISKG